MRCILSLLAVGCLLGGGEVAWGRSQESVLGGHSAQEGSGPALNYTFDVAAERESQAYFWVMPRLKLPPRRSLHQRLFTPELTKELKGQYKLVFNPDLEGYHPVQVEHLGSPTRLLGVHALTLEQHRKQKEFGSYMLRRLSEYHVGKHIQRDRILREAWQMKTKLEQTQVSFWKGTGLRARYSLSGNYLLAEAYSPYVNLRMISEVGVWFESGSFSKRVLAQKARQTFADHSIYTLHGRVQKKNSWEVHYVGRTRVVHAIAKRRLTSRTYGKIIVSPNYRSSRASSDKEEPSRGWLGLLGFTWNL